MSIPVVYLDAKLLYCSSLECIEYVVHGLAHIDRGTLQTEVVEQKTSLACSGLKPNDEGILEDLAFAGKTRLPQVKAT